MADLVKFLRQCWRKRGEAWSQRVGLVPASLLVLGGTVVGGILALMAGASGEWTVALVGLLGVALGGVIAAATNFALERERWKGQLTMATWADRVRAHQQAYDLWTQILHSVYEPDPKKRGDVFHQANDWYSRNCLYLTEEARDGFRHMYFAAMIHQQLVDTAPREENWASKIERNWEKITSLDRILIEGSGGHISEEMSRDLRREREQQLKKYISM